MSNINQKTKKGFTLIELLVVIAIIALLSTVVLANIASARKKAQNVKKLSDIRQYVIALNFFADKYGYYPYSGGIIGDTYDATSCLGTGYPGGTCSGGTVSVNSTVNSQFAEFFPSMPSDLVDIKFFGTPYNGYTYRCQYLTNGKCTRAAIGFMLDGLNRNCLGTNSGFYDGAVTACDNQYVYTPDPF
jgi:prepilin-type N-terminal cleavage/methylation domain-containing protein